jgi:integrase
MPRRKRPEGTRAPNGTSSIYLGSDGYWHGRVTMGVRDDGKPDRRHVKRKTETAVIKRVRELEAQRDSGKVTKAGNAPTVEQWLTHWVENIASASTRYKALAAYRTAVYRHLIPNLGAHRINRLEPEHFEKLYRKMQDGGLKAGTAHQVHRTARTAFGEAVKRGRIARNPVELAKPPRIDEEEPEPFDIDDINSVVKVALTRRNGVRYVVALALGLRQGEALALQWSRFDKKLRVLEVRKQLQRQPWQHGCKDAHACGAKWHKTAPCPQPCKRHTRECPRPCAPTCTGHARNCPQRHGGGLVLVDVKSRAGRRDVATPDELYDLLLAHEAAQAAEKEFAGTEWHDEAFMFAQENGKPIDPTDDLEEWHSILSEAGVSEARLHDARHTAATVLALLGVPSRTAMYVMGWSNPAMVVRYQHVTEAMRRDVADRIGRYLWGVNETPKEG